MASGFHPDASRSLFPSRDCFESIPDPVRATGVRAIRELHQIVEGKTELRLDPPPGNEWLRSICVLHDHLRQALLSVDSMLTAGASHGTLHAIIEEATRE